MNTTTTPSNDASLLTSEPTRQDYEDAALAAGATLTWWKYSDGESCRLSTTGKMWTPLTDVADSHRLMTACIDSMIRMSNGTWNANFLADPYGPCHSTAEQAIFWTAVAKGKAMRPSTTESSNEA